MRDLFKNLWDKTQCQKNGVCTLNPVLNAIDAVIINEIRQIAFYVVKLKEFNLININIMKEAVCALSISITDTTFDKNALNGFYQNLVNIKNEIKDFYVKKCSQMNISYEFNTPFSINDTKNITTTNLIKEGENILNRFYNKIEENKIRLIHLIIAALKITSVNLLKLNSFKNEDLSEYYFEILRLLSLTNNIGTREEKFIRRIKEFSEISYKIKEELDFEMQKAYGKRKSGEINTDIFKGKSILVSGGDLDELYLLLEKTKEKEINIYFDRTMLLGLTYPEFVKFKNLKGMFGNGDIENDFSNFKGVIYVTRNSTHPLDSAIRGKIYTTKKIPFEMAVKIENNDFNPLIEETKNHEGFSAFVKGKTFELEYDLEKIENLIEENKDKKFLVSFGVINENMEEKFRDYIKINFVLPYETEGMHFILNRFKNENLYLYFSDCSPETINNIVSLLNKTTGGIYLSSCPNSTINPHITDSLKKDFNINII